MLRPMRSFLWRLRLQWRELPIHLITALVAVGVERQLLDQLPAATMVPLVGLGYLAFALTFAILRAVVAEVFPSRPPELPSVWLILICETSAFLPMFASATLGFGWMLAHIAFFTALIYFAYFATLFWPLLLPLDPRLEVPRPVDKRGV